MLLVKGKTKIKETPVPPLSSPYLFKFLFDLFFFLFLFFFVWKNKIVCDFIYVRGEVWWWMTEYRISTSSFIQRSTSLHLAFSYTLYSPFRGVLPLVLHEKVFLFYFHFHFLHFKSISLNN